MCFVCRDVYLSPGIIKFYRQIPLSLSLSLSFFGTKFYLVNPRLITARFLREEVLIPKSSSENKFLISKLVIV